MISETAPSKMVVIWIDRTHAKCFEFSEERMERGHFQWGHPDHHTHRPDQFDIEQQEKLFFNQVAESLNPKSRILILGPGIAKHHFQNHLNEHFPKAAKNVAGCESMDHPTDPQIAAYARKYFGLAQRHFEEERP